MMVKIYVVTSGEYSDYGINLVTLNKAYAEKYVEEYNKNEHYGQAYIEEYEDNVEIDKLCFEVSFDVETFDLRHINVVSHERKEEIIETTWAYRVVLFANNSEAAVKIAAERLAQYVHDKKDKGLGEAE